MGQYFYIGNSDHALAEDFKVPINKFESVLNKVDGFTKLGSNWDGHNGIPLIEEIAKSAKNLFLLLGSSFIDKVSDIFPNPHGTITVEWETRKGNKLSLEIGRANYSYFIKYQTEPPKLIDGLDIISDAENLTSDLGNLFSEEIQKYLLQ